MSKPAFSRPSGNRNVSSVEVGPLLLVARRDSHTLCAVYQFTMSIADKPAKNEKAARRAVIDEARKLVAEWSAQLDQLTEDER